MAESIRFFDRNSIDDSPIINFTIDAVSIVLHELIEQLHIKELFIIVDYENSKFKQNTQNKKIFNGPPVVGTTTTGPKDFFNKFQSEYRLLEQKLKKFLKSLSSIKLFYDFEDEVKLLKQELINLHNPANKTERNVSIVSRHLVSKQSVQNLSAEKYYLNDDVDLLFSKITDKLILENIETPFIYNWYNDQVEQKEYIYTKMECDYDNLATYYKKLMISETKFSDQITFVQIEIENYIYLIEEQSRLYEIKMEEMERETDIRNKELEKTKKELVDYKQLYQDRIVWLKETIAWDSAILIQKWWREKLAIILKLRALALALKKGKGKGKGKGKKK